MSWFDSLLIYLINLLAYVMLPYFLLWLVFGCLPAMIVRLIYKNYHPYPDLSKMLLIGGLFGPFGTLIMPILWHISYRGTIHAQKVQRRTNQRLEFEATALRSRWEDGQLTNSQILLFAHTLADLEDWENAEVVILELLAKEHENLNALRLATTISWKLGKTAQEEELRKRHELRAGLRR